MMADGISAALARYPEILLVATATSTEEAEEASQRADAVALDLYLPGAPESAKRLRRKGKRVVFIGDGSPDEQGVCVSAREPVASLAAALVPGAGSRRTQRSLTTREREVLSLAARGLAGKQVARHLGISPKTVEQHKTRIFAKLGVPNQTAAVSIAMVDQLEGTHL
jgi:DNA-binding NarL/FixJ family response regulator